ncbi:MAG: methionine adenosyltransferase [Candidatus Yanofskybacteria bacterium]|nr:methionine adenosyltransferase [Candidatus Yanofskybacteria bacterium]
MPKLFTAESVTSGHPDKICDQISDTILDAFLEQDPKSRVAVETFGSSGLIVVGGEVTSKGSVDVPSLVNKVYKEIGYKDKPKIVVNISRQSPDIAMGVDTGGAGDQGIMYGYATDETHELLPLPVVLAHKLTGGLEKLRRENPQFSWLRPDGKSQVTVEGKKVSAVVVSCQHDEKTELSEIRKLLLKNLIKPVIGSGSYQVLINPTGRFVVGGFVADTGLTGRKIMVDTYGGLIPHGGGCFSGKDASKVDRSAAYMARFAAKNIVANKLAKKCLVSVAYAIGKKEPLMVEVDTFATGDNLKVKKIIKKEFDFSPLTIIERLGLRKPIFAQTATYGHFGKPSLPWEKITKI